MGNFNLYSLFTPLILKGDTKRVLSVSSGHADLSLVSQYHLEACVAYAASKAAHNMITGKFHARYARDGVLFISVCPGTVDTLDFSNCESFCFFFSRLHAFSCTLLFPTIHRRY